MEMVKFHSPSLYLLRLHNRCQHSLVQLLQSASQYRLSNLLNKSLSNNNLFASNQYLLVSPPLRWVGNNRFRNNNPCNSR